MNKSLTLPTDVLKETDLSPLNLSSDVKNSARSVCEYVQYHPDSPGSKPSSIAASAVYIATLVHNEKRTQDRVADVFDTTAQTIMKTYPKVAKVVDESDIFGMSLEPAYVDRGRGESQNADRGLLDRLWGAIHD